MNKIKDFKAFESEETAAVQDEAASFAAELESAIKALFPGFGVRARQSTFLGHKDIDIYFSIGKDKSEYPNSIPENDAAKHTISIAINKDGTLPDKMAVTCGNASMYIKSVRPHMVYDRVKFGWRNFAGDRATVLKRIVAYFEKVKKVILENVDKMDTYAAELVKSKIK